MQDYIKLLEATNRASVQRKHETPGGVQYRIMEEMENLAVLLRKRLDDVLPQHMEHVVSQVKLDLMDQPIEAPVLYKAQFSKHDRKNFQLRVYAHQQGRKGKGVKLARAVYFIRLRGSADARVA